jgi:hypothetical protein
MEYNYDNEVNFPQEDYNKIMNDSKQYDSGYNVIHRYTVGKNGIKKRAKIEIYTTGGIGSNIRDAETGEYYTNKVGSLDEYLFYKVGLATGECKSRNGSNVMFFRSPQHCMKYLHCEIDQLTIQTWQERVNELSKGEFNDIYRNQLASIVVG